MKYVSALTLLGLLTTAFAGPALADRAPTAEEKTGIETKLKTLGYMSWGEVEFDTDTNQWDVNNAMASDHKQYDLKLNAQTLDVISKEIDN